MSDHHERFSVGDRTAVVTGASSGIGRAIAEEFAADGANVVVCSRERENVEPVAEGIREQTTGGEKRRGGDEKREGESDGGTGGGDALAVECDVTDRDAVEALVEATVEEYGGLDVLVNNAGASFMANFEDISPNGWRKILDINLGGTYNCTQAAGEYLKADDNDGGNTGGSVVNIASVAGQQGAPYMSHYGAAKAAVVNLTSTLAYEWAGHGVRVNCIAPGFVATPGLASQMGIEADEVDREAVERRVGTSEEIADVARFLASDAASFVVGETVAAAGVPDVMETPDA